MPTDRRLDVPGGAYFFSLNLRDRRRRLLTEDIIRDAEDVDAPIAPIHWNPFRYTGRKLDPETGLYYYRARDLRPVWSLI